VDILDLNSVLSLYSSPGVFPIEKLFLPHYIVSDV